MKKPQQNTRFNILTPTPNFELELPGGSYTISGIKDSIKKWDKIPLYCCNF